MKTKKNRLFDELKGSMISKKSMSITKGGTTTSDANETKPGGGFPQDQ